jgi:hypothetical protein
MLGVRFHLSYLIAARRVVDAGDREDHQGAAPP